MSLGWRMIAQCPIGVGDTSDRWKTSRREQALFRHRRDRSLLGAIFLNSASPLLPLRGVVLVSLLCGDNSVPNSTQSSTVEIYHYSRVVMTLEDEEAAVRAFQVGNVVETAYGVGVLVEPRSEKGIWVVRLWRLPGKSVATAALAYLHQSAVSVVS